MARCRVCGIVGGFVNRSGWSERAAFIAGCVLFPALIVPHLCATKTHPTSNWAIIIMATEFRILAGGMLLAVLRHVLRGGDLRWHSPSPHARSSPRP
jgi:hypothetical protein